MIHLVRNLPNTNASLDFDETALLRSQSVWKFQELDKITRNFTNRMLLDYHKYKKAL